MPEEIELPEIEVTPDAGEGTGTGTGTGEGKEGQPNPGQDQRFPPRRPGSKEIATLIVRGTEFRNWTSIQVRVARLEAFPTFQFECTEEVPIPATVNGSQFVPGDVVLALLGGHAIMFGFITERHVGYDAKNHGVRLIGVGDTADLTNSMVPLAQLGNHDGKNVQQLARDLSAHLNIMIKTFGAVDPTPFENIQVLPGETPMATIERYAKMRNIDIGSLATGGMLLVGPHSTVATGDLVEGVHILRANCVVRDQNVFKHIIAIGQNFGNDQHNNDPTTKMTAHLPGSSTRNRHMIVPTDIADNLHGVQQRAQMEYDFTEGSLIEAHITVQGWFKDNNRSDDLWRAGEYYMVHSPSLILNGRKMGCSQCVYEQSNSGGTTTTLTMVKEQQMKGRPTVATRS